MSYSLWHNCFNAQWHVQSHSKRAPNSTTHAQKLGNWVLYTVCSHSRIFLPPWEYVTIPCNINKVNLSSKNPIFVSKKLLMKKLGQTLYRVYDCLKIFPKMAGTTFLVRSPPSQRILSMVTTHSCATGREIPCSKNQSKHLHTKLPGDSPKPNTQISYFGLNAVLS